VEILRNWKTSTSGWRLNPSYSMAGSSICRLDASSRGSQKRTGSETPQRGAAPSIFKTRSNPGPYSRETCSSDAPINTRARAQFFSDNRLKPRLDASSRLWLRQGLRGQFLRPKSGREAGHTEFISPALTRGPLFGRSAMTDSHMGLTQVFAEKRLRHAGADVGVWQHFTAVGRVGRLDPFD